MLLLKERTLFMKSDPKVFQKKILDFYKKEGRHTLPWRKTTEPYLILVSEVMLQQTQVERVIPKYEAFIRKFPTVEALANAQLVTVLTLWSGLGYNRRARFLHMAAKEVVKNHKGVFPSSVQELQKIIGIGPYTAGAVMTFAFNYPIVIIETNIRSVYIHEFFKDSECVTDSELLPYIKTTLDIKNPRRWYAALMDYGAHVKKAHVNPSRKSKHHVRQSAFQGSLREVRGRILPFLFVAPQSVAQLAKKTQFEKERIIEALQRLADDGLAIQKGRKWELPE